MFDYVLNSLLWSGAGFIAGFLVGKLRRPSNDDPHDEITNPRQLALGVLIAILGLFTVTQGVYLSVENRDLNQDNVRTVAQVERQSECIARLVDSINENLDARYAISGADREALDTLVATIRDAASPEELRVAIDAYLETRAETDVLREETPLPPISEEACNE